MNGKIFNLYQANKFIKLGATVEGCGISRGKAYIEFKTDNLFYELIEKWNKHQL